MTNIHDEILYNEALSDFASLIQEVGARRVASDFSSAFPHEASELHRYLVLPKVNNRQTVPMRCFEIEADDCRCISTPLISGNQIRIMGWEVRLPKLSNNRRCWRRVYFCPVRSGNSINGEINSFYYIKTNDDGWLKVELPTEFMNNNP